MCVSVVGIQLEGSPEPSLSFSPIPIVEKCNVSQRCVGLADRTINRERLLSRLLRLRHGFSRICHAQRENERRVGVSQSRVSRRVIWIFGESLLEIINSPPRVRFVLPVQKVSAFQIQIVGISV